MDAHEYLSYQQWHYDPQMLRTEYIPRPPTTTGTTPTSTTRKQQQKKSSRACDYCRKKKVRCDIDDHESVRVGNRCTTCHAQDIECTFERVPLQRGPARGYKHKANERKLKLELQGGGSSKTTTPQPELSAASSVTSRIVSSGTGTTVNSPAIMSPVCTRREPVSTSSTVPSNDRPEWIPQAINKWYLLYQHTLPMLEPDMEDLHVLLTRVHPLLRSALLYAIYALVFRSRTPEKRDAVLSEQSLTAFCATSRDAGPGSMLDRLVYLQTTMVLTIDADQRGFNVASFRAGHAASTWLAASVGQAYSLRLHSRDNEDLFKSGYLHLGQRLWFILIVLDRWHSISTSSPPFIADCNARVDIDVELPLIQMSSLYNHLYRLSVIVGHVYAYVLAPHVSGYSTPTHHPAHMLRAELEEWRAKVDVIWGQSNLLHIAYWHVSILSIVGSGALGVSDLLQLRNLASRLSSTLPNSATPVTPLNHHFYALCLCVQCHLLEFQETREDAIRGLQQLREAVQRHADLVAEDEDCWDVTLLKVIDKKLTCPPTFSGEILLRRVRRRGYLLAISSILE